MNAHQALPPDQEAPRVLHYYETALLAAINTDDEVEACNLVERMHRYSMEYPQKSAPLVTALIQNENFLMRSIRKQMHKLAKDLFDTGQFKKREILLQHAAGDRSLINFSIDQSNLVALRQLLRVISEVENNVVEYAVWLRADKDKDTPLHFAVREENNAVYLQVLLDWMEEGKYDPVAFINAKNIDGDTPFHLLFTNSLLPESMRALMSYGADLDIVDNDGLSPMDHLTSLDPDRQWFLLNELHRIAVLPGKMHCGKVLLDNYRRYLIKHPDHTIARSVYFRARALLGGLQDLLYAHHEFNPEIPLRNPVIVKRAKIREDFFVCQDVTPEILLKAEYKHPPREVELAVVNHPSFQDGMPLYIKKLGLFGESSIKEVISINQKSIDDIAQDINRLLDSWRSRRKKRAAGIFVTIESALVLLFGLMEYFRLAYQPDFRANLHDLPSPQYDSYCASKYNADPKYYCMTDKQSKLVYLPADPLNHVTTVNCVDEAASVVCDDLGTIFLYLIGFFIIFVPAFMAWDYFNKETEFSFLIKSDEWQPVLNKLKQKIIQPLSLLNGEVSQFYPNQLKELNAVVEVLKEDLSYEKALPEFKKILTILTILRQEIEQKKCGFPVEASENSNQAALLIPGFHLTR